MIALGGVLADDLARQRSEFSQLVSAVDAAGLKVPCSFSFPEKSLSPFLLNSPSFCLTGGA